MHLTYNYCMLQITTEKEIVTNCKFSRHIPGFDHKEQVCKCNGNIYKTIENTKFVR